LWWSRSISTGHGRSGQAVARGRGWRRGSGKIAWPACLSDATAVAASEEDSASYLEKIAPYSNYSPLVKLVAPGTGILQAIPGGGYERKSGTSFAAPQVAGAFALLKAAKPDASVDDMEAALSCTGNPLERNDGLYKPRIDLFGAYNYLRHPGAFTRSWDFANPQQAFDWEHNGLWRVYGGQFVVTPTVPAVEILTADPNNSLPIPSSKNKCLGDSFTVEATMTRIYPNDSKASTFPGTNILFKSSDLNGTGYDFSYTYLTDTQPPGALLPGLVAVSRCDRIGIPCTELCTQQATTDNPFTVNLTAPNTLKVVSKGSNISSSSSLMAPRFAKTSSPMPPMQPARSA
jgi:Subtilase family